MFRLAQKSDLEKIVAIYNQTIASRTVTADLEKVSVEDRLSWFNSHDNNKKYPLWVYELNKEVLAWCSYSQFYSRSAYDETVEISFYIDKNFHGLGIGSTIINFLKEQMTSREVTTLLSFVFSANKPSLKLLEKNNFSILGTLPNVANMESHKESLIILGYSNYT